MKTRARLAAYFAWPSLVLAMACRSSGAADAGSSSPCDEYFDAITANPCGTGPTLPDSETARVRSRFERVCAVYTSLPGSTIGGDALEACAAAIQAAGCAGATSTPAVCAVMGTLPTGAACNEPFQCQSGVCFEGAGPIDAGPSTSSCGQCVAVSALGQPCQQNCTAGAVCDFDAATPTCVVPTVRAAGASCDGLTLLCGAGLYCDTTGTCTALLAAGEPCTSGAQCAPPATCPAGQCQAPGTAGAGCEGDEQCVAGLACSVASMTCGAVTWSSSGQPCGDLTRCLVGACELGTMTCPTVIDDGQPCSPDDPSATCDRYAQCTGGVCVLVDAAICM
jgi:hypothetical protein